MCSGGSSLQAVAPTRESLTQIYLPIFVAPYRAPPVVLVSVAPTVVGPPGIVCSALLRPLTNCAVESQIRAPPPSDLVCLSTEQYEFHKLSFLHSSLTNLNAVFRYYSPKWNIFALDL